MKEIDSIIALLVLARDNEAEREQHLSAAYQQLSELVDDEDLEILLFGSDEDDDSDNEDEDPN